MWGAWATAIFAVGFSGAIAYGDGASWSAQWRAATLSNLNDVWAASPSEAFAAGDSGAIVRYAGGSWTAMTNPLGADAIFYGVWGFSPSDAYAVGYSEGYGGVIVHSDGNSWTLAPPTLPLNRIWGSSSSDVYAVGCAASDRLRSSTLTAGSGCR